MKTHKGKYIVIGIYFFITVVLTLLTPIVSPLIGNYFSKARLPEAVIPDAPDTFSREYISNLKDRNLTQISEMTHPEVQITQEQIDVVSEKLSNIQTETGKVLHVKARTTNGVTGYELTYEFNNSVQGKEYVAVNTIVYDTEAGLKLAGIQVNSSDKSFIQSSTSFDFKKQGLNWALLILLSLLATWSAMNYMKNSPKPRWWVLLVILVIVMKVQVIGENVSINFGPIVSNALNKDALFIAVIPLGAIYYWIARKKIFAKEQTLLNTPIVK